jgi:cardiolipin synthase
MKKSRFSGQYFSIPNLLSYFRFLLIPPIVWLYCFKKEYNLAALVMALSAATDVVDGWIARKFNMITDWGKIIDPFADKLSQIAVAVCLAFRFRPVWFLVGLLAVKEFYMGLIGLIFIRKTDMVVGAAWFGKLSTVCYFFVALILIIAPLFTTLSDSFVLAMVLVACSALLLSVTLYTLRYIRLYSEFQQGKISVKTQEFAPKA